MEATAATAENPRRNMSPPGDLAGLLAEAAAELTASLGLEPREARLETQVLAAHALNTTRTWVVAHSRDPLSSGQANAIQTCLARRLAGEPVAYILGYREFYGHRFRVTPDVLIPRPETELLVEAVLQNLPSDRPARVLDLGTGSGCVAISLALARPDCLLTGLDVSSAALAVARENAQSLGARVELLVSDWFATLADRVFDVIVANPPYIARDDHHLFQGDLPWEPLQALASGEDGLDALRHLVRTAAGHLSSGGLLLLEHGWEQGEQVCQLLAAAGYLEPQTLRDLEDRSRCSIGRRPLSAAETTPDLKPNHGQP